jgi:hypothetical protein
MSAAAPEDRIGPRGRVATAVAATIGEIPHIGLSKTLTRATLYPGGVVEGVVLSAQAVTVHLLVDPSHYGDDLRIIADDVRRAIQRTLRRLGDPRSIEIHIDDLGELAPQLGGAA